jgi:hypothetical protein
MVTAVRTDLVLIALPGQRKRCQASKTSIACSTTTTTTTRIDAACVHPAPGFTQQDNLIPWHLQKSFKKEAWGHGQDVEQKNRCARSTTLCPP